MRKALVVGINYYERLAGLYGCVDDAYSVIAPLERHSDGSVNFNVRRLTGTGPTDPVTRAELKDLIVQLFADDSETAVLYFAGHGHIESTGGYLLGSDATRGDDGVPLGEVLALANESKARNKVIVLDSCHSGIAGATPNDPRMAQLSEGLTILTASTAEQYAKEDGAGGVFTNLFVDALGGAAANLVGDITPGSVYAHIDQSLGPWDQRPLFKTNVKSFVSLRKVQPPIDPADLRRINEFFPAAGDQFQLDPSFEPEDHGRTPDMPLPDPNNVRTFRILQKYSKVNLVVPVDAPHMWHAAMQSRACKLTVLGEHYRRLAARNAI